MPVVHFWDSFVWYHTGGEEPGHYRVEVYANGVLTNRLDYSVGTVPIPTPEPTLAPTATPFSPPAAQPQAAAAPPPAPPVERPRPPAPGHPSRPPCPCPPTPTPAPTLAPSPTPLPTPQTATATTIGGMPVGLDINPNDGHIVIADGSGVLWMNDPDRPTSFDRPTTLGSSPVDLIVDPGTGYVFISARNESAVIVLDSSGKRLASIPLPATPGDLRLDANLGLLYVVPARTAGAGRRRCTIWSIPANGRRPA